MIEERLREGTIQIERRTWQLAESCLRDPALTGISSDVQTVQMPDQGRWLRGKFAKLKTAHPIARHFFVWQEDVRFPLLELPAPLSTEEYLDLHLTNAGAENASRFKKLLEQGEEHEFRQARLDLAFEAYSQCSELPMPDSLKALALARKARCLKKTMQPEAAADAYRELMEKFGDLYDLVATPYALSAARELRELAANRGGQPGPSMATLVNQLAEGRWELTPAQVDFWRSWLERELKGVASTPRDTEFLSHLRFASALHGQSFRGQPDLSTNILEYYVHHGDDHWQTFYTRYRSATDAETLVGFAVDPGHLEKLVLADGQSKTSVAKEASIRFILRGRGPAVARHAEPFPTLFPFLELAVATPAGQIVPMSARRDALVFSAVTIMVIGLLVLGVVLLLRDVSRQMQLSQLRSDLVSSVSHELKTPLTLIRLYGETLLYRKRITDQQREDYYRIITRESERLTHLIDKVLDFSRIDRGQKQYDLQEGNLAQVVASTVAVYEEYLSRQGFTIESALAPEAPPARFDADAVSEAVLNLMENAAKYSGESKWIRVDLWAENLSVIFQVEDRGVGIEPAERERIFQQFYRGPGHKEKGGYGLGLYLVKHIMDAHGGNVEVESDPGRGSRFRLIFGVIR